MKEKLELKRIIWLFIPMLVVFYMFLTNYIGSINSQELKFKVTLYDPYDIIRGKYLDITLEDTEVIIPELLTVYEDEKDYQNNFILTYKKLSDEDKELIKLIINNALDEIERTNRNLSKNASINEYKIDDDLITYCDDALARIDTRFGTNSSYGLEYDILKVALVARKCNLDFFEIVENVEAKVTDSREYREYRRDLADRLFYAYYDVDDEGYATFKTISTKKIKGEKNYLKTTIDVPYSYGNMIWYATIDGRGKQFFIDERLSKVAEYAVRDAINEDKEVVIVAKLANGNMQITKLLVDGEDIFTYLEKYQKAKELEKELGFDF